MTKAPKPPRCADQMANCCAHLGKSQSTELVSTLSLPSSFPPSHAHASYILCDCLCRGWRPRRWLGMKYWGHSVDLRFGKAVSDVTGKLHARKLSYLWILVRIAATSYVGLQRFCKMSRHSSPVPYTFGWNIWLMNFTPGGLLGYCSSKFITRRNVPSSKGVSAGPMMTAFLEKKMSPLN